MSYAGVRFVSTMFTAVVGAVLGVGAFSLTAPTERWLGFSSGCATLIVVGLAFLKPRRGAVQRALDLPAALIGGWLIVSTRAVENSGAAGTPGAVKWLNLAAGAALCGIGWVGLMLHEAGLERDLRQMANDPWSVQVVRNRETTPGAATATITDHHEDALSRAAGR